MKFKQWMKKLDHHGLTFDPEIYYGHFSKHLPNGGIVEYCEPQHEFTHLDHMYPIGMREEVINGATPKKLNGCNAAYRIIRRY